MILFSLLHIYFLEKPHLDSSSHLKPSCDEVKTQNMKLKVISFPVLSFSKNLPNVNLTTSNTNITNHTENQNTDKQSIKKPTHMRNFDAYKPIEASTSAQLENLKNQECEKLHKKCANGICYCFSSDSDATAAAPTIRRTEPLIQLFGQTTKGMGNLFSILKPKTGRSTGYSSDDEFFTGHEWSSSHGDDDNKYQKRLNRSDSQVIIGDQKTNKRNRKKRSPKNLRNAFSTVEVDRNANIKKTLWNEEIKGKTPTIGFEIDGKKIKNDGPTIRIKITKTGSDIIGKINAGEVQQKSGNCLCLL